jgi:hypothetical protein
MRFGQAAQSLDPDSATVREILDGLRPGRKVTQSARLTSGTPEEVPGIEHRM